jgi:hypothetical protein
MPILVPRKLNLGRRSRSWVDGTVYFRVLLSAGLADQPGAPAVWDSAIWDTDEWGGNEPSDTYWYDVTDWALAVQTSRGKDRFEDQMRTGTFAVLLDNQEGLWNPIVGQVGTLPALRPGRWFRLESTTGGEWEPVFTGYIDSITDEYSSGGFDVNTRIAGYGFAGVLQMDNLPRLSTPVGGGELTSERVNRILDTLSPTTWSNREIQTGVATMLESTLERSNLEEILTAAEAEGGVYFHSKESYPVFKARDWLVTDPRSTTVQARIGGPISQIHPLQFGVDWSAQRIYNDVQLAREGGVEQRATEQASIDRYFRRTFRRTGYQNDSDADVLALAERFLGAFAWDRIRVETADLWPRDNAEAATALELEIGDLAEVTVSTGAGWAYTTRAHIFRIDHMLTASDWRMELRLDDAQTGIPPGLGAFDDGFDDGFT